MISIKTLIKGKDLTPGLEIFREQILDNTHLIVESLEPTPDFFVDYLDNRIKRRALTISKAFEIAVHLYLFSKHPNLKVNSFLQNSLYSNQVVMTKAINTLNELKAAGNFVTTNSHRVDFTKDNPYESVITKILNMENNETLQTIAEIALDLAWVHAYNATTFFPGDLYVMTETNEQNILLVKEIENLLRNTEENLLKNYMTEEYNFDFYSPWLVNLGAEEESVVMEFAFIIIDKEGSHPYNLTMRLDKDNKDKEDINDLYATYLTFKTNYIEIMHKDFPPVKTLNMYNARYNKTLQITNLEKGDVNV